jgi:hypothetical protein
MLVSVGRVPRLPVVRYTFGESGLHRIGGDDLEPDSPVGNTCIGLQQSKALAALPLSKADFEASQIWFAHS